MSYDEINSRRHKKGEEMFLCLGVRSQRLLGQDSPEDGARTATSYEVVPGVVDFVVARFADSVF